MQKPTLFPHRSNVLILSLLFFITIFYLVRYSSLAGIPGTLRGYNLKCIQMSQEGQNKEGVGAIIRRNQLAFFLAETYGARLSFPHIGREHGYQISNFFDRYPEPKDSSTIHYEDAMLLRSPRGDCACHRKKLDPYVKQLVKKCCSILVINERGCTTEYSGCFRDVALTYLTSNAKETVEFNEIQLRGGDLAHSQDKEKVDTTSAAAKMDE